MGGSAFSSSRSWRHPMGSCPARPPEVEALGWWGIPLAVLSGAIRGSTPFLFVSLGECLTEKSGRINLGLEGTLVMGAMSGCVVSYLTGWPLRGDLAAGALVIDLSG